MRGEGIWMRWKHYCDGEGGGCSGEGAGGGWVGRGWKGWGGVGGVEMGWSIR